MKQRKEPELPVKLSAAAEAKRAQTEPESSSLLMSILQQMRQTQLESMKRSWN